MILTLLSNLCQKAYCLYFVIHCISFQVLSETAVIPQIFDEFLYELRVRKLDNKLSKAFL